MKKLVLGVVLGLLLGLSIPAYAHRDNSVSRHLYKHIHNMAHRLIEVEKVVWKDLPGFLECLRDTGTYACPIPSNQVRASATALCAGRVATWKADGSLECAATDFIRTGDGKTEWDRLLCDALKNDFGDPPNIKTLCEQ